MIIAMRTSAVLLMLEILLLRRYFLITKWSIDISLSLNHSKLFLSRTTSSNRSRWPKRTATRKFKISRMVSSRKRRKRSSWRPSGKSFRNFQTTRRILALQRVILPVKYILTSPLSRNASCRKKRNGSIETKFEQLKVFCRPIKACCSSGVSCDHFRGSIDRSICFKTRNIKI